MIDKKLLKTWKFDAINDFTSAKARRNTFKVFWTCSLALMMQVETMNLGNSNVEFFILIC